MLKDLSLASLGETKVGGQFKEAMEAVKQSIIKDGDVHGARSITVKLSFSPDDRGNVAMDLSVSTTTPNRKLKTTAVIENDAIRIDADSNDARLPFLTGLDGDKGTEKKAAQGGSE